MRYVVTGSMIFLMAVAAFAEAPPLKWKTLQAESGFVAIVGNVRRPHNYIPPPADKGPLLLRELFWTAGGVDKDGEQISIELRRPDGPTRLLMLTIQLSELDERGGIELRPNDFIYVTEPTEAQ